MARGWHYQTLSIECPSSIFFWNVLCTIVPLDYFCQFFVFVLFSCSRWSFVSTKYNRYSSDLFPVQQTTYYRIDNHVYYWVSLRPDWLVEEHNKRWASPRYYTAVDPLLLT